MSIKADVQLDCKGLSCPMPIVRTKKAIDQLEPGQVIEVQATDPGSLADIQGWAKSKGHQYLGTKQEGDVLKHYLRKASESELEQEQKPPDVIQNEELLKKLDSGEDFLLLDVREPAEYSYEHIPGACSIPLGQLEDRIGEMKKDRPVYVICRTGTRSNLAAQLLTRHGFSKVFNVIPGMSEWTGPVIDQKTPFIG
ncbi:sulfurtransferase TusA family protein [Thermoflavimicrobium dichotomicum]|uniref:Rhodanese-related sulfurtransferase n=1 Tax=Thermoflavimicrobium dichotomicum TaxID=46223 RepID=A0A1I3T8Y2_9BACL|nr:sulfurtransferase TusA family protein [Thermoflavimicrobium dichotomicum]SFJ67524.1 Rhodanese-related sulfurtransferase [Thermoflavimicrobium dichotomicum]